MPKTTVYLEVDPETLKFDERYPSALRPVVSESQWNAFCSDMSTCKMRDRCKIFWFIMLIVLIFSVVIGIMYLMFALVKDTNIVFGAMFVVVLGVIIIGLLIAGFINRRRNNGTDVSSVLSRFKQAVNSDKFDVKHDFTFGRLTITITIDSRIEDLVEVPLDEVAGGSSLSTPLISVA